MGRPSRVGDADVRVEDFCGVWLRLLDEAPQFCDFANLLESKDLVSLVAIYGETSRIITTVFETLKA